VSVEAGRPDVVALVAELVGDPPVDLVGVGVLLEPVGEYVGVGVW
jgi:hypothetical protein